MTQTHILEIHEPSQIASARRTVEEAARSAGLDEEQTGKAGLATVELSTNLLNHAKQGFLLLNSVPESGIVDLTSVDKGPGIGNLEESFRDGYSSAGTPGLGLGSVRRLSQSFDIYSQPSVGTVVSVRIARDGATDPEVGVVCTAIRGEVVSGDTWGTTSVGNCRRFMIADGLGHGLQAAEAALLARRVFLNSTSGSINDVLEAMHGSLRTTRGAAIAIVESDMARRVVRCCGVGNISCQLQRPTGTQSLVSHNGTVGHQVRKIQTFEYTATRRDLLIMHSDGIATRWKLSNYPGLMERNPRTIAAVLYRDANRGRDDATVLVTRID